VQQGGSVSPALKAAAFSQFPRCPDNNTVTHHVCFETNDNGFAFMGFSIRSPSWRYTEWRRWDGSKLRGVWSEDGLVAQELCEPPPSHQYYPDRNYFELTENYLRF
jgi:hypothetical protein